MDRIDIRIPVEPVSPDVLLTDHPASSAELRVDVIEAADRQIHRYKGECFSRNRDIPVGRLGEYCALSEALQKYFAVMARQYRRFGDNNYFWN